MPDHGLPTSLAETCGDLVTLNARYAPHEPALTAMSGVHGRRSLDYAGLDDHTNRLAAGLLAAGVGRGDRVAFLFNNDSAFEAVLTYTAAHKAGAVAVPINGRLVPAEVVKLVRHSRISTLVFGLGFEEHGKAVGAAGDVDCRLIQAAASSTDFGLFDSLLENDGDPERLPEVSAGDYCDWLYTSGTTGDPKCVMLTHFNCVAGAHMLGRVFTVRGDDMHFTPFPFFSSSGTHTTYLTSLTAGAHYYISENTRAEKLMAELEAEGATMLGAVPAIYSFMVNSPERSKFDLSLVRHCWFGGAAINAELVRQIQDLFPRAEVVNVFGQTESGNPGTYLPGKYATTKAGSIGRTGMPGVEIKVIDSDGNAVERDGVGELLLRSKANMQGYFENEEATRAAFTDDWLHTGDLVAIDSDGFLVVHDRIKDIIIRGGHNVASIEVESALNDHPDVVESAVVAKPHPALGEDVMAFIVRVEGSEVTPEELQEFCRPKIADFKIPHAFEFIEALPRNPTGKILKRELRERAREAEKGVAR